MTAQDDEDPEYLTLTEASGIFGISLRTLARWMEEGRIPCVIASGEKLVSRGDLDAIVTRPIDDQERNGTEH